MILYIVIGILVVGLILSNYGWLYALIKLSEMWHDKQSELLDRINVLANKPPMPQWRRPTVKPGGKAPNEMKPSLSDQMVDPEWEAVGKIDPGFIDRAREENGK
jgi:hypothetical protein